MWRGSQPCREGLFTLCCMHFGDRSINKLESPPRAYSSNVPGSGSEPSLWLRLPTRDTHVPRHDTLR